MCVSFLYLPPRRVVCKFRTHVLTFLEKDLKKLGKGIYAAVVVVLILAAGLWVYSALPSGPDNQMATMVLDLTPLDSLAGSQDAATSAVGIYRFEDARYELQETVTMDAAAKASVLTYTTGEELWLKLYDGTDTSVCTQYMNYIVPFADPSEIYGQAFQVKLDFVDRGNTAKDISITESNGTAMAASGLFDMSGSGYDTAYATWEFDLRALDDDTGYINTYNFLKAYENYHYLVIDASGTGWDSVTLLSSVGWTVYERADTRYFVYKLSNDDLTRDKKSTGEYDPDGRFKLTTTWDLTGITAGDSVTFNYQYMWYSSFQHFQASGSWGVDTAETAEVITLIP